MSRNSKFVNVTAIALLEIAFVSAICGADTNYELKPIRLPGATGPVALDYFAYDHVREKLWVPASNTGSVDVIDGKTDAVRSEERRVGKECRTRWWEWQDNRND